MRCRKSKIEALRLLSMLMIVAGHYFSEDNWACHTDGSLLHSWSACFHNALIMFGQIGVCLFVLISAFFLSKSNSSPKRRLIRLWVQVEFYSVSSLAVFAFLVMFGFIDQSYAEWLSFKNVLTSFFPVVQGAYWFISAFFVLNLVAPYVNKLLDDMDGATVRNFAVSFCMVTFVWKFINPANCYFNDILYLVAVYIIGYIVRRYLDQLPSINLITVFVIISFSYLAVVVGTRCVTSETVANLGMSYPSNLFIAGPGASPLFSLLAACPLFIYVVQKGSSFESDWFNRAINAMASATLGVYLIHENMFLKPLIWATVFQLSEPASILEKMVLSSVSIIILYTLLLLLSFVMQRVIVERIGNLASTFSSRRVS